MSARRYLEAREDMEPASTPDPADPILHERRTVHRSNGTSRPSQNEDHARKETRR